MSEYFIVFSGDQWVRSIFTEILVWDQSLV